MATITSITIPSFTGLKSTTSSPKLTALKSPISTASSPKFTLKASLKDVSLAMAATAATAILASNALALEILLGGDDGSLAFVPNSFTVSSGDTIVFKNNAGFPHNVVFDPDEIPSGVDANKISMDENDLLNAPGETYKVALTEKGSYSFYCSPHQGAGMVGTVTVN